MTDKNEYSGLYLPSFGVPGAPDDSKYWDTYGGFADDQPLPPSGTGLYTDQYGEYTPPETTARAPKPWRIYVRDGLLRHRAQVGTFIEFTAVIRWNDVDTWTLTLPWGHPAIPYLVVAGGGIDLMHGGDRVMAGPVQGWTRTWQDTTNQILFYGWSDDFWIASRVAHQQADAATSFGSPHRYTREFDVQTGPAEDVLTHLVNVNLGPGAIPERRIPIVIVPSQHRGSVVTSKARMQQLSTECRDMALAGGDLGWRLFDEAGTLTFRVFTPRDRRDAVVFSPQRGNISDFTYDVKAPASTFVYVSAWGEKDQQEYQEASSPTEMTRWGRIETYNDASDITVDDYNANHQVVLQHGYQQLSVDGQQFTFTATAMTGAAGAQFVDDWMLGDITTSMVDGAAVADVIRQVEFGLTAAGLYAKPSILGDTGASPWSTRTAVLQRRLLAKLRDLERR